MSFSDLLPGAACAIVEIAKLHGYALNPLHPEGRHKARVFLSALGIHQSDAEWLRSAILAAVLTTGFSSQREDRFGVRYVLDIELERHGKRARVRTGWILRSGEVCPRLTTCYVV